MSVSTNTLYACINSQKALADLVGGSAPRTKMLETLGTYKALKLSEQTGTTKLTVSSNKQRPASGTNRKVTVFGYTKTCPTIVTSKPGACTAVTAETTNEVDQEVVIANYHGDVFTLDHALYLSICEGASDAMARKIAEAAEGILKAENDQHIADLLSDADTYFGGKSAAAGSADEKLVNLYSTAGTPQPTNLFTVIEEYRRKGYAGIKPIVIGGTTLSKFMFDLGYYQGVNDAGLDFSRVPSNTSLFVDYELDTVAQGASYANGDGASRLFSFIPGHAQMLNYHDYAEGSPLRYSSPDLTQTTIMVGDEMFDLTVYNDMCHASGPRITVTVGRWSDIWIPASTFFTADCSGEQSLLSWTTDCADTSCSNVQLDHSAPAE